jgi:tetratricopeptide (TPR) repeat protein
VLGWAVAAWLGGMVSPPAHAVAPSEAEARDPRAADEAYAQALAAYERGEMLEAAEGLARAYALDPRPIFHYQRGHALREAGSCRTAIEAFEAFIAVATTPEDRRDGQDWIDHCRRVLAAEPEPEVAPAPEPEPEVAPAPEPEPEPRRVDRWGIAGVGVGAGLLVGGAALLGSSYAVAAGGSATPTETDYLARERRTAGLSISGIALMAVGGAALVAASIRLGVVAARRRGDGATSRVAVAPGGVVVRF